MNEIKEALKNWLLKVIATASRSEFWVMIAVIAVGALKALQEGADWITVLIGVLTALTGGTVYTYSRTKRKLSKDETYYEPLADGMANGTISPVVNEKGLKGFKPTNPFTGSGNRINWTPVPAPQEDTWGGQGGWDNQKATGDELNPLPVSVTSLVKDRVKVAMKLAATDEGMWDVLFGKFNQIVKEAIEHFSHLNPNLGDIEAAKKVVDDMYQVRLDSKSCSIIQSMIGLPQAIFAKTDENIIRNIKAAIERDPKGMAWQKEQWKEIAIQHAKDSTIREAADRVKNPLLPIKYRELALQEFGMSPEDAHKTQWSGGTVKIYYVIPGGTGGTYIEFDDGETLMAMY